MERWRDAHPREPYLFDQVVYLTLPLASNTMHNIYATVAEALAIKAPASSSIFYCCLPLGYRADLRNNVLRRYLPDSPPPWKTCPTNALDQ